MFNYVVGLLFVLNVESSLSTEYVPSNVEMRIWVEEAVPRIASCLDDSNRLIRIHEERFSSAALWSSSHSVASSYCRSLMLNFSSITISPSSYRLLSKIDTCPSPWFSIREIKPEQVTWSSEQSKEDLINEGKTDEKMKSNKPSEGNQTIHPQEDIPQNRSQNSSQNNSALTASLKNEDKKHEFLAFLLISSDGFSHLLEAAVLTAAPAFPNIAFVKGDGNAFHSFGSQYKVTSFPKLILFRDGLYHSRFRSAEQSSWNVASFLANATRSAPKSFLLPTTTSSQFTSNNKLSSASMWSLNSHHHQQSKTIFFNSSSSLFLDHDVIEQMKKYSKKRQMRIVQFYESISPSSSSYSTLLGFSLLSELMLFDFPLKYYSLISNYIKLLQKNNHFLNVNIEKKNQTKIKKIKINYSHERKFNKRKIPSFFIGPIGQGGGPQLESYTFGGYGIGIISSKVSLSRDFNLLNDILSFNITIYVIKYLKLLFVEMMRTSYACFEKKLTSVFNSMIDNDNHHFNDKMNEDKKTLKNNENEIIEEQWVMDLIWEEDTLNNTYFLFLEVIFEFYSTIQFLLIYCLHVLLHCDWITRLSLLYVIVRMGLPGYR